eukprot:scaffold2256_cov371-Prasinococcus_capsulatus_cf.AAC.8
MHPSPPSLTLRREARRNRIPLPRPANHAPYMYHWWEGRGGEPGGGSACLGWAGGCGGAAQRGVRAAHAAIHPWAPKTAPPRAQNRRPPGGPDPGRERARGRSLRRGLLLLRGHTLGPTGCARSERASERASDVVALSNSRAAVARC